MPTLTELSELPDQQLLVVCAVAIALTAVAGWLYASRVPAPPRSRARGGRFHRRARPARRVVRTGGDPTQPIPTSNVLDDVAAPMSTSAAGLVSPDVAPEIDTADPPRRDRRSERHRDRVKNAGASRPQVASKGKLPPPRTEYSDVRFSDVAGVDEAVEELAEIKEYLLDPNRFRSLGAVLPKGVLLVGPPGTGKTLLTKALAGEAGVPYQVVSAASLVEVYVGLGAARVHQIFEQARKVAPSIVFLDELDAIGRTRTNGALGGQEERESTLNQLLVEMDGFDSEVGVLVIGATNRPDVLDPALLRPGRFDRRLVIDPPDLQGRRAILAVHSRNKPLAADADLLAVARRTIGFTGADLANVMNEAALLAARRRQDHIGRAELEEAVERVMAGPERRSRVISETEKRVIAYHESGHVLASWVLAQGQNVHKVSIVSRGRSHGYTLSLPSEDRVLFSHSDLVGQLAVLLGGRAAEELVFGEPTTGAEDDLRRATRIAHKMVTDYGMSTRVGPVRIAPDPEATAGHVPVLSGAEVVADVDNEVRRLVREGHQRVADILRQNRAVLDELASSLLLAETLEAEDLEVILKAVPRQRADEKAGGADPGAEESIPA
ncbi:MAG: ATP-dependent zinc metalloprotease FtsH [Actinomycetota bacterium]|nr:ATP-dependent zinc metalloprotease FtsH [Actinomycetota bacterium]